MSQPTDYRGYRFQPDIIRHVVWLYFRVGLSFRDVEDLLAERRWCAVTSVRRGPGHRDGRRGMIST